MKGKILSLFLAIILVTSLLIPASVTTAAGDADLTVTGVSASSSTIYDADKIKFNAIIRNVGGEEITESFFVNFYVNGVIFESVKCSNNVKAGGMTVVQSTKQFSTYFGTHKVTAYVNYGKDIEEIDYTNNSLKSRFVVIDDVNPMPPVEEIPKNPTPLSEPKTDIYDAADQTILGLSNLNTENDGYTGDGYVEYITRNGDGIEFKINADETAQYKIKIRYAASGATTCGVAVNNDEQQFNFGGQNYWDSWDYYTFNHQLNAGENTITIKKRSNADGGNINIDSIEVTRVRTKRFNSFTFLKENNPNLKNDINCEITDTGFIYAYIPSDTDITNLVASYDCTMPTVKVLGKEQQSGVTKNDFTNGHIYNVSDDTQERNFTVLLYKLTDTKMPNVFVEFSNDVSENDKHEVIFGSNKEFTVPCYFTVRLGKNSDILGAEKDVFNTLDKSLGTIKLRGNSTLHQPKKSWKVKLDAKTAVLDMPKSKHWILLASYDDKSMLRQHIGYELARNAFNSCGYSAPRARYCNLFMNGKYNGVYLLMEQLKLDNGNRVNADSIEKFYSADKTNLTGGYLLELDSRQANYAGDEPAEVVFTAGGYWFAFKDPDEDFINQDMKDYMAGYLNEFIATLKANPASGDYRQYIDVDSFVDWYLAMEIMKNLDAAGNTSVYCYKVHDGKLYMGPAWDFDISSGNVNYSDSCMVTSGWHIKGSFWYRDLFKDPYFVEKVKERYAQFRAGDYDILNGISTAYNYIEPAMGDNFKKWNYLSTYYWPEPDVLHTYKAYGDDFYNWMDERLKWLDENIPNL
jgi:hypothetical protein